MSIFPISRFIKRDVLIIQIIPTFVVFVVLLTFAVISWRGAETTLKVQKERKISEEMSLLEDAITTRMEINETLLRSGVAFFDGSDTINRDEWNRFYTKFRVQESFQGVSTLGYAPIVQASEREAYEQTLQDQGLSTTITPSGDREVYVPVMYYQVFSSSTDPTGFDAYSSQARRDALTEAGRSGMITMSNKVELYNADNEHIPGVVLYMPVYVRDAVVNTVAEREASLRGYVFLSLRLNELFSDIALSDDFGFVVKGISDDQQPDVLFSTPTEDGEGRVVRSTHMDIFQKQWKVDLLASGDIVSSTDNQRPSTVLSAGIAISIIASIAVYLLVQFRTRSFALSEERKLQQAKDELLSLASHQLRTPATGVKQYIGMVIDGFGGRLLKGQAKLLEQAYKSNERQLQIINEFLYVAKLGSGSLTTTSRRFDVIPVLRDVIEEMALDIEEKQHDIKVKTPKNAFVCADEHSVRMIVENLLSNAIKYTPDRGKIRIVVEKNGGMIQVHFEDNGIGIAKKDTPLLFKQFSRIPSEFSANISGSGIGLYLSQQLAERNGGSLSVKSKLGEGSTFTMSLPIKSVRNLTQKLKT